MENRFDLNIVRSQIADDLARYSPEQRSDNLQADKWILSSGFQKSIRRGDIKTAQSCAASLIHIDKPMLWRRTMVTALEDVGIGDPSLAAEVIAASADAKWRKSVGGDMRVISYLIEKMCEVPKDRSADHLLAMAQTHPDHRDDRHDLAGAEIGDLLDTMQDDTLSIATRAVAAWYLAGTDKYPSDWLEKRPGDLEALFWVYERMGVPMSLLEACQVASRRMRNTLPVLMPLVWTEFSRSKSDTVHQVVISQGRFVRGIPTYALGGHTRLGKRAIKLFLKSSEPVREYLRRHLEPKNWPKAVEPALFHTESATVSKQRIWDRSQEIERLGVEADLCRCGLDRQAVDGLLNVVRDNLDCLDQIRVKVMEDMKPETPQDLFSRRQGQ